MIAAAANVVDEDEFVVIGSQAILGPCPDAPPALLRSMELTSKSYRDTWVDHVLDPGRGHAELRPHFDAVLATIATPDHHEDDVRPGRQRFYKRNVGPSRWLMAVVSFEQEPARVVTATGYGHGRSPDGWMP